MALKMWLYAMHAHLWSDSDDVKLKFMNYFYAESHRNFSLSLPHMNEVAASGG